MRKILIDMKVHSLMRIAFLLILAGFFSACSDNSSIDNPVDMPFDKPAEVSIEVYSLYGTMCNWSNRKNNGKVIVINSDEEMKKYLTCYMNGNYHPIDFSKQSLLLVGSVASSGVYAISPKSMQQLSTNKYVLNVEINLNELPKPFEWDIAIRSNKLSNNASVELKVNEVSATTTSFICKWKLIKSSGFMVPGLEYDYSQNNIVYEFKSNGVLAISGDAKPIWPELGEHSYTICNYGEMLIGSIRFWYQVSSSELVLDGRPLDGFVSYLSKIK